MRVHHYVQDIPVIQNSDVVVCGGGCAGLMAAIASARNGAETILVERYGLVGGTATAGLVGPFMTSFSDDGQTQLIKGLFDELVNRMEALGGAVHPAKVRAGSAYAGFYVKGHDHVTPFDPEIFKYVAMEMLQEAGVKLYLHTTFVDAITENGAVKGIVAVNKEGLQAFRAKITVDCTGDGEVAVRAGAEYELGRKEDGLTQPMTLFFRIAGVDDARLEEYIQQHPEERGMLFTSIIENSQEIFPRNKVGIYRMMNNGEWRVNTTRVIRRNPVDALDLAAAEMEGLQQVMSLMKFFRKYLPGFEDVQLVATGSQIGVRESRRIMGEYVLQLEDLLQGTHFADCIAMAGFPVDIHSPTDIGGGMRKDLRIANAYQIPYRILVPRATDGLLVAGRCVSASHEALGAIRVMPPVFAMGQAAGTAAAIAVQTNVQPRQVNFALLQQRLLEQGAVLPDGAIA